LTAIAEPEPEPEPEPESEPAYPDPAGEGGGVSFDEDFFDPQPMIRARTTSTALRDTSTSSHL
jgi:hypothetical protein